MDALPTPHPLPASGALRAAVIISILWTGLSDAGAHEPDAGPDTEDSAMTMPGMPGLYGPYGFTREGSGTSWVPDTASMGGLHTMSGDWMTMLHGGIDLVHTEQGGPRGDRETYNTSMLMLAARRSVGADALSVRLMASLEPLGGPRGYPLLFQTGETANGVDPLVDRQHPHNLLMEAAAGYSWTLKGRGAIFVYGGPIAEPALGPPAFMHRFSSADNPEAPLSHHWLDSTHMAFGAVTLGAVWDRVKLEGSAFNGREPNQHRYDLQLRGLDSWSARLSWNPTPQWALQVSTGNLASPEALEPDVAVRRTTLSAIYDRPWLGGDWQTTLAWGRNRPSTGPATDAYLLDSAVVVNGRHTLFGRLEHVGKAELYPSTAPLGGAVYRIDKASLGYVFEFASSGRLHFGIGGVASIHRIPTVIEPDYGAHPSAWTVFLRARLAPP